MKPITDINQLDPNGIYNYADYLTWNLMERVELLWGKIKKMSPAPSTSHQRVLGDLFVEIKKRLDRRKCQVFTAPFDVRLAPRQIKDEAVMNVVQPDICIICDESKLDERGCSGPPDLIIEIISPSSASRDLKDKLDLYEKTGVPEYWVVDPYIGTVQKFFAGEAGEYRGLHPVTAEDRLKSETIPGLEIDMQDLFPDIFKEPEEPYGAGVRRI